MNKLVVAGAAVVLTPLVAVLGFAGAMRGAAATVPGQCGAGGPGALIGAVDLSAEQLANAQTIVSTTQQAGLPTYAAVVAVATAMTESTLHNSSSQTDHDSEGLFQQRVSIYTEAVAINPVAATQAFLSRLVGVPNWQTIPLTEAAADVQIPREDLRGRYAQWESLGFTLAARYWSGTAGATAPTCTGDGGSGLPLSGGGIPAGFTLPADPTLAAVVGYALAQLGKPYVYAAEGPDSFDCSGLVMAAWAQGGVALPRTTYNQVTVGTPVGSLQSMTPGDLIFIAGSDGTNANPGHVGMYIGAVDGKQYLVHAPQTGEVVKVATVSSWGSEIVDVRHPGGGS